MSQTGELKIAVVGLGYVGLPLAVEFGKKFDTIGYDLIARQLVTRYCRPLSCYMKSSLSKLD